MGEQIRSAPAKRYRCARFACIRAKCAENFSAHLGPERRDGNSYSIDSGHFAFEPIDKGPGCVAFGATLEPPLYP